jgi:hypothetical protein
MAGDESSEAEAWRSKVRSVDDTLKALRAGSDKAKPKKARPKQPSKPAGRGLFSFLNSKPGAKALPLDHDLAGE